MLVDDGQRVVAASSPWRSLLPVFAACGAIGLQAGVGRGVRRIHAERAQRRQQRTVRQVALFAGRDQPAHAPAEIRRRRSGDADLEQFRLERQGLQRRVAAERMPDDAHAFRIADALGEQVADAFDDVLLHAAVAEVAVRGEGVAAAEAGRAAEVGLEDGIAAIREQLRDRVAKSFRDVMIAPLQSKDTTYYRVHLGTFPNRIDAEERARQVTEAGYPVIIIEK